MKPGAASLADPVADLTIGPPAPPEVRPQSEPDRIALLEEEHVPHVDETVVRGLVRGMGGALGHLAGDQDVPDHWRFTDQELDDLTPPLTRVINRHTNLRRAVLRGDEMAIAVVLAGYAGRNVATAHQARERRRELNPEAEHVEGDLGADGSGVAGEPWRSWGDGGRLPGPPSGGAS